MCIFPNGNLPKVHLRIGLALRCARMSWGGALRLKQTLEFLLGKFHIWEVATWENTVGKLPLEEIPLGKDET